MLLKASCSLLLRSKTENQPYKMFYKKKFLAFLGTFLKQARETMVSLRETNKGEALDRNPKGYHGPPSGDDHALCACTVTQRVIILCFAQACIRFFPMQALRACMPSFYKNLQKRSCC